jgi:hypothetical protein
MSKIQEFISPAIAENLGKELLTIVGNTVQTADTSLYERKTLNFRDIIDNNFPTMLIVDYASIRSELRQYQDIDAALKTYISETYNPTEKDYKVNKFSDKEIDLLLTAIRKGMESFSNSTAISIPYKQLQSELTKIFETSQSDFNTVARVKQLFNKVYKLVDISNTNAEVYIFPTFANLGGLLRGHLDIGLAIAEVEVGQSAKGVDSIGQILAYGHTAAGYLNENGDPVLNFNSPKLLAVMFDILSSSSEKSPIAAKAGLEAATFFVNDTRQTEVFITVDKEFSQGFLKTFVSVGGNIVKLENSLINSRRGSVLEKKEKRGVNKAVLEKLAAAFTKADSIISKRLARYILTHKKSPNILEYVQHTVVSALKGEKPQKYTSKSKISSSKKDTVKKEVISGIAKSKVKLPKEKKPPTAAPTLRPTNLQKLLLIINQQLQDVISANMGDGSRRDILNYRTGRLASSATVGSLSQSRDGMITAFYSYMKNPYATFSQGGRQESPRTRDPKLLIATSIREIAAQHTASKLRAVLV